MAYFPLIVIFTQRYRKDAGIGTVVSLMLPCMVILAVLWTLFFIAWYLVGIPLGPGRARQALTRGVLSSRSPRSRRRSAPLR
jgi:p-aminobenzoyl-glutamate transporter AbgT